MLLTSAALSSTMVSLGSITAWSLPAANAADPVQPLQRFPRMMQDWLVNQVRRAHQQSVDAKAEAGYAARGRSVRAGCASSHR